MPERFKVEITVYVTFPIHAYMTATKENQSRHSLVYCLQPIAVSGSSGKLDVCLSAYSRVGH